MTITAKILKDSVNPAGARLTTMEVTYNRWIHCELLTHRVFSRNAASSRAIPIEKMIQAVIDDPAIPVWWGRSQKGMQAAEELEGKNLEYAKAGWLRARDYAINEAKYLSKIGLHKQVTNRLLEPWAHITVILSSTNWTNFFNLRAHKDAQPEFQDLAFKMKACYDGSEPRLLDEGRWHLPLIYDEDIEAAFDRIYTKIDRSLGRGVESLARQAVDDLLCKVSAGRCARVSYLTHEGKRNFDEDLKLYDRLDTRENMWDPKHMSPLEHVAQSLYGEQQIGNFRGWLQLRKTIEGEAGPPEPFFDPDLRGKDK